MRHPRKTFEALQALAMKAVLGGETYTCIDYANALMFWVTEENSLEEERRRVSLLTKGRPEKFWTLQQRVRKMCGFETYEEWRDRLRNRMAKADLLQGLEKDEEFGEMDAYLDPLGPYDPDIHGNIWESFGPTLL